MGPAIDMSLLWSEKQSPLLTFIFRPVGVVLGFAAA